MSKKWELAEYYLTAKKAIDTILYIHKHHEEISPYILKKRADEAQRLFYINCAIVVDNALSRKTRNCVKAENEIIRAIYYERDKKYAHADNNYARTEFSTFAELAEILKSRLKEVYCVCKDTLPSCMESPDFVVFDSELLRIVNCVDFETENRIMNFRFPCRNNHTFDNWDYLREIKVLNYSEDIKSIPIEKREKYGIILNMGLTYDESIQSLQDSLVLMNICFGTNTWVRKNYVVDALIAEAREKNLIDELDRPIPDANWEELDRILSRGFEVVKQKK